MRDASDPAAGPRPCGRTAPPDVALKCSASPAVALKCSASPADPGAGGAAHAGEPARDGAGDEDGLALDPARGSLGDAEPCRLRRGDGRDRTPRAAPRGADLVRGVPAAPAPRRPRRPGLTRAVRHPARRVLRG